MCVKNKQSRELLKDAIWILKQGVRLIIGVNFPCSTIDHITKMFCTFCVTVRTISRACGFHVQEAEQVPLLPCPPMRCSDAMAHEL